MGGPHDYPYNGNPHTWKTDFIIKRGPYGSPWTTSKKAMIWFLCTIAEYVNSTGPSRDYKFINDIWVVDG